MPKIGTVVYKTKKNPTPMDLFRYEQVGEFEKTYKKNKAKLRLKKGMTASQLYKLIYPTYEANLYGWLVESLGNPKAPVYKFLLSEGWNITSKEWEGKSKPFLEATDAIREVVEDCPLSQDLIGKLRGLLGSFDSASFSSLCKELGLRGKEKECLSAQLKADESPVLSMLQEQGYRVDKSVTRTSQVVVWVTKEGEISGQEWARIRLAHKRALFLAEAFAELQDYGKACFAYSREFGSGDIPVSESDLTSGAWEQLYPHPKHLMPCYVQLGASA